MKFRFDTSKTAGRLYLASVAIYCALYVVLNWVYGGVTLSPPSIYGFMFAYGIWAWGSFVWFMFWGADRMARRDNLDVAVYMASERHSFIKDLEKIGEREGDYAWPQKQILCRVHPSGIWLHLERARQRGEKRYKSLVEEE